MSCYEKKPDFNGSQLYKSNISQTSVLKFNSVCQQCQYVNKFYRKHENQVKMLIKRH